MRLLVTHPDDPSLPSSWSKAPYNLIEALRQAGDNVIPVATGRSRVFERVLFRLLQHVRRSDFTFAPLFRAHARHRLMCILRRERVDAIIHCATTSAVLPDCSVAQYLYCDSTWNRYVNLTPNVAPPSARIRRAVDAAEAVCYRHLKHIFAFSSATQTDLVSHYALPEQKVSVIGTGCGNIAPYFGRKDYSTGKILFVATWAFERKGGRLLLQAFRKAVEKNPKLSLTIDGGSVPEAAAAGIRNVTILGKSRREVLQQLFNEACLYAMPALFEPWGNVYIEALASRTPILGLMRHSLPDITRNGEFGFLVDTPDPDAVCASILDATNSPERLAVMGSRGQKHVLANYTWEVVAHKLRSQIALG